jgi:hypothetical protein
MADDEYAELLKQIAASLKSIEVMTSEIGTFLAAQRLRTEAQMAAIRAQSAEASAAFDQTMSASRWPGRLMSGRWPRRDGTGYPVYQPLTDPDPNADSKTGNLRPINQR